MRKLLLLPFLFFFLQLQAENSGVSYLTVEDGLTQNEVTGIIHDSKGFMWFSTRGGLNRYDGYEFVQFKPRANQPNTLSNPSIESLYEDRSGRLWIGTKSGGVDLYDPRKGTVRNFRKTPDTAMKLGDNRIISIYEQENGNMWFGGWSGGLTIWEAATDSLKYHFHNMKIAAIKEDKQGNIWLGTNQGVYGYDAKKQKFTRLKIKGSDRLDINDLIIDSQRNVLWVTAWNKGLIRYDMGSGTTTQYLPGGRNELDKDNSNNSYSLLLDSKGKLWMGTWGGGLYCFDPNSESFSRIRIKPRDLGELNTDYDIVLKIIEDRSGTIWIGTDGGGVCRIGKQLPFRGISTSNSRQSGLKNFHVLTVWEDQEGCTWIGTKGGGLYYSTDRRSFTEVHNVNPKATGPDYKVVKCIYESPVGEKWVGTNNGLHRLIRTNGEYWLKSKNQKGKNLIRKILSISQIEDKLLVGSQQQGFWVGEKVNTPEEKWTQYIPETDHILRNERISLIQKDNRNRIWVGSYKGIYFFDDKQGKFSTLKLQGQQQFSSEIILSWCQQNDTTFFVGTPSGLNRLIETPEGEFRIDHYYREDGLPDDYIHAVMPDEKGNVWISTNSGISRLNTVNQTFSNYDESDGLQGRSFSEACVFRNASGELYFGGASGFNYFSPSQIYENPTRPDLAIIGFSMHNRKVVPGEEVNGRVILKEDISYTKKITLTHRESEFSLTFSALGYDAPERHNYAYRLLNHDKAWNYSGTNRTVTYNQLRAGNYIFEVKGSNNHNVWNEEPARLEIKVIPAPWRSWWAIVIYIIIALGLVTLIRWVAVRQSRLAHKLDMEKLKFDQEREINEMKLRFFTNISHEFRTPLTLILGPVQELLSLEKLPPGGKKRLQVIEQNSKRLLRLVGQLLDFRKAETGKMKISVGKQDLVKFLKQEMKGFYGLAEANKVDLHLDTSLTRLEAWFDPEKLGIVINNLLSNAFKYVAEGGEIAVRVEKQENCARIQVCDNGRGIPSGEVKRIFDRFYQVDSALNRAQGGSGIGLALVKRIVELHSGTISVESELNVKTIFSIDLPFGKEHFSEDQLAIEPIEKTGVEKAVVPAPVSNGKIKVPKTGGQHKHTILVVEDQEEISNYLHDLLQEDYEVIQATDGLEGYARCMKLLPDLIVTDVMMPGMDGFEFCEKVKKEERTAHIPIVMLTAKSADQYKIKGITIGADAFISKPFHPEELMAQVASLLRNRKTLKDSFSKKVKLEPTDVEITSHDETFLNQAIKTVEKHLHDQEFNADVLASSLNMSTSTLYRKLKAVTGMSTNIFIRSIRLKRAAQLLADPQKTIAEISVQVGISDLKYFRKCFRELYGCPPSEYRQTINSQ